MKCNLCKCGCNKEIKIKSHHKYYGIPHYISGHNKPRKGVMHSLKSRQLIQRRTKEEMNKPNVKKRLKEGLATYWNSSTKQVCSRKEFFKKISIEKAKSIKGKTFEEIYGIDVAKKLKLNQRLKKLGKKRNKHKIETIEKIRRARFNQKMPTSNTVPEIIMKNLLNTLKFSYIQQYNIEYKTIADFFIPKYKLAIYCDGCYWHSHDHMQHPDDKIICGLTVKQIKEKDKMISQFLSKTGYSVFRVWECELKNSLKNIETKLMEVTNEGNS